MKKLMLCLALVALSFAAVATPTQAQRPVDEVSCRDCCAPLPPSDCIDGTLGYTTCEVWLQQHACQTVPY